MLVIHFHSVLSSFLYLGTCTVTPGSKHSFKLQSCTENTGLQLLDLFLFTGHSLDSIKTDIIKHVTWVNNKGLYLTVRPGEAQGNEAQIGRQSMYKDLKISF